MESTRKSFIPGGTPVVTPVVCQAVRVAILNLIWPDGEEREDGWIDFGLQSQRSPGSMQKTLVFRFSCCLWAQGLAAVSLMWSF